MPDLSSYFSIMSSNPETIVQALTKQRVTSIHATNGAYVPPQRIVVPTTVAGFQYIHDTHRDKKAALLVAVNSNKSMQDALMARGASQAEFDALEDQYVRARKIVPLLATQFPTRRVVFAFYDTQDPVELYKALHTAGFDMRTLHKWGYGTGDNPKPILGAEFFENVHGFPFAATTAHMRPAFWDVTPEGQKGTVKVADLTQVQAANGQPYLSIDNKLQFPVASALAAYTATPSSPPLRLHS